MTRGMINSQMNLNLLDTCYSTWMHMGPYGSHPRVLKDLGDVIAGPLYAIFQWSSESASPQGMEVGKCCDNLQEG